MQGKDTTIKNSVVILKRDRLAEFLDGITDLELVINCYSETVNSYNFDM